MDKRRDIVSKIVRDNIDLYRKESGVVSDEDIERIVFHCGNESEQELSKLELSGEEILNIRYDVLCNWYGNDTVDEDILNMTIDLAQAILQAQKRKGGEKC